MRESISLSPVSHYFLCLNPQSGRNFRVKIEEKCHTGTCSEWIKRTRSLKSRYIVLRIMDKVS